jgi:acylphosphatase
LIQGPKEKVEGFIRWVKRGPGLSQVVVVESVEFLDRLSPSLEKEDKPVFFENILQP